MLEPLTLIRLSIEIENQVTPYGDLIPHPGKDKTLFSISQYEAGSVSYFHEDIPASIRTQIVSLDTDTALNEHELVQRILSKHEICNDIFSGIGYYFAEMPLQSAFPDVVLHQGCYAVMVNGVPVSWAWSSDGSPNAVELAVETTKDHRRKGYARQVASAWAYHNIKAGKVAFYSHRVDNLPSRYLAGKLGVSRYARVTTYAFNKQRETG